MRELNIELTGNQRNDNIIVRIDGNTIDLKKNADKLVYNHQTENERVKVEVFKLLNVGGFFWFLTQIFFFLITFFGLFGTHKKEKCLVIDFEIELVLGNKNTLALQLNNPVKDSKAIEIQTDSLIVEKSNITILDSEANKVIKFLKFAKLILAVAIIVTTLLLIR